ncbi:hypothetical protein CPB83DRAFT_865168 [Crepidotus variabilis]|uniref:Uncharacterized protein n=1 Tax=Crepidotus variabilis TaxID=179855 RepID=A0A9P6JIA9_9AGAR|nr:hypothetical protein CPB83DRAFT_865168 [Crepidotus variabilis]
MPSFSISIGLRCSLLRTRTSDRYSHRVLIFAPTASIYFSQLLASSLKPLRLHSEGPADMAPHRDRFCGSGLPGS